MNARSPQTTKLETHAPTATEQVLQATTSRPFTSSERDIILKTCCGGASPEEARQLIAIAEARGLNPIAGECYFVQRLTWNEETRTKEKRWAVQASIDAFRIKAEESGLYDGQDEPEYEYGPDNKLLLARVRVYRKGWSRPAVGVARYDEYEQTTRDGTPTKFWKNMPHNQLAKCAEALAMRKAFPRNFAKVYTAEEMAQEDERDDAPAAPAREADGAAPEARSTQLADDILGTLSRRIAEAKTLDELQAVTSDMTGAFRSGAIDLPRLGVLQQKVRQRKAALTPATPPVEEKREREPGEEG